MELVQEMSNKMLSHQSLHPFSWLYSTIHAQRFSIPASNSDNFFFVLFYHQIPFNFVDFSNLYLFCRMNQKLFLPSALVCFAKFHRISHFVRMKVLPKSIYLLTSRYGMVCARVFSLAILYCSSKMQRFFIDDCN